MRKLLAVVSAVVFAFVLTPRQADAACSVCQQCQSNADCGSGETCHNFGGNVGFVCTVQGCQPGGCPGDSVCYELTVDGSNIGNFCLNPDANTAWCHPGYACFDDGQACSGLGTDCSSGAGACSSVGSALCVSDSSSSWCSCHCETDADCGSGNSCITLSDGTGACKVGTSGNNNGGNTGLCEGITCGVGQVCDVGTGKCVDEGGDLCASVTCPNGGVCSPATGTCIGGDDGNGDPNPEPDAGSTPTADMSSDPVADAGSGGEADAGSNPGGGTPDASFGGADAGGDVIVSNGKQAQTNDNGGCTVATRGGSQAPNGALFGLCALAGLVLLRRRRQRC